MEKIREILKRIQERPEAERKTIFWVLAVILGVLFFGGWLAITKERLAGINKEKVRQDLRLPELEEELSKLPKLEMPKFDQEQIKQLEELLRQQGEVLPTATP
ncbi:MAG: hypothetical protein Q8N16_04150 [bacterium]|nr:hypothetical protein [bacterium]